MQQADARWRNGGRLLSVALLGGLALNGVGAPIDTMDAHAQNLASQSWLTLEHGWLCRSWSAPLAASVQAANLPSVVMSPTADAVPLAGQGHSAAESNQIALQFSAQATARNTGKSVTHCTTLWHISSDGRLISDASAWAPNPTGEWPALADRSTATPPVRTMSLDLALKGVTSVNKQATTTKRSIASVLVIHTITPPPAPKPVKSTAAPAAPAAPVAPAPGGIGAWTPVPGHPTYSMSDYAGDPNSWEFGVCTWWGAYMRRDEPQLGSLGVATNWISNARAKGMSVGYTPVAGATVVFDPGVQGAGGGGHVGHVEQVLDNGWFIMSEMNFYWNGGGWGRVDWRYVHSGSGVAFIY